MIHCWAIRMALDGRERRLLDRYRVSEIGTAILDEEYTTNMQNSRSLWSHISSKYIRARRCSREKTWRHTATISYPILYYQPQLAALLCSHLHGIHFLSLEGGAGHRQHADAQSVCSDVLQVLQEAQHSICIFYVLLATITQHRQL